MFTKWQMSVSSTAIIPSNVYYLLDKYYIMFILTFVTSNSGAIYQEIITFAGQTELI